MAATNPFVFAAPLEREEDLVGRDCELAELHDLARSGTYTLLEAPRRYGKTSLVKIEAERWRADEHGLAVWIDFSRVLSIDEATRRVRQGYLDERAHGRLAALLRELLERIRIRIGPVELGPALVGPADPADELHELLDMTLEVAKRTAHRALVILDEVQDVLEVPGLDGLMRSHIQHHQAHVTYVFAGSEPSLLRELFGTRARPLYGQAKPLRIGRIDREALAVSIARKFRDTGKDAGEAAATIALVGGGHPQRTMLLAWHLWQRMPMGRPATREDAMAALNDALQDRLAELDAVWRSLSSNEGRTAVALAHGLAPTGTRAQRATALSNRTAAQRAVGELLDRGEAERMSDGRVVLTDPLLAAQLRRDHPLPGE